MLEFKGPKLTTKLICQAPMIHFQHYENGATLRASEVKPKFDRYLIKKVGWEKLKKFRIGTEGQALDYKMRIVDDTPLTERWENIDEFTLFYGNENKVATKDSNKQKRDPKVIDTERKAKIREHNDKHLVNTSPKLIITCFNKDLQKLIIEHLHNFFFVTNFGTMQSKGFGSFIVERSISSTTETAPLLIRNMNPAQRKMAELRQKKQATSSRVVKELKEEFKLNKIYCMDFSSIRVSDFKKEIFDTIKEFYTLTRSGINFGFKKKYARSPLVGYMYEKFNLPNEKVFAKKRGLLPAKHPHDHNNNYTPIDDDTEQNPHYFNRALLGINYNMGDVKIAPAEDQEIERLSSRIFFKIIDNKVYIIPLSVPDKLYGMTFDFSKGNKVEKLNVPSIDAFKSDDCLDTARFLEYAVKYYNEGKNCYKSSTNNEQIPEKIHDYFVKVEGM